MDPIVFAAILQTSPLVGVLAWFMFVESPQLVRIERSIQRLTRAVLLLQLVQGEGGHPTATAQRAATRLLEELDEGQP